MALMHRLFFAALTVAFLIWMVVALRADGVVQPPAPDGGTPSPPAPPPPGQTRPQSSPVAAVHDLEVAALRAQLKREHTRLVAAQHRVRSLTRTLAHTSSTREAIQLACSVYGNCETLWRRAGCETGGTFSPRARNRASGAAGLYQFLPSTWATTPFAAFSIWSPYANALAAGWMQTHGRGSEWVCR